MRAAHAYTSSVAREQPSVPSPQKNIEAKPVEPLAFLRERGRELALSEVEGCASW